MVKGFKKGLSVALAVAMVFSTPIAFGQNASISKAAEVTLPTPISSYDMSSNEGITITTAEGAAKAEIAGGVLKAVGGVEGNNKIDLDTDLSDITAKDGITVSFDVKAGETDGYSPLFSFTDGGGGFFSLLAALEVGGNLGTDPNTWIDPTWDADGNTATVNDNIVLRVSKDKSQRITMTVDKESVKVYVDGLLYSTDSVFGSGTPADLLAYIAKGDCKVRLGSWTCSWWTFNDFAGEFDNVKVYDKALTTQEVYKEATGIDALPDALVKDAKAEITTDGKAIKVSYSKKDYEADKVVIDVQEPAEGEATSEAKRIASTNEGDVSDTVTKITSEGGNGSVEYTPAKNGEYTFTITASKDADDTGAYVDQVITAKVKVAKDGDKLLYDEDIASDLKVENGSDAYTITWKTSDDSVKSALTVTGNGKTYTADKFPYTLKYADLTDGAYKVTLVATKDGNTKRELTADINYKKVESTAGDKPGTNFANITTQPVAKYVFDGKDTDLTLSSKATLTTDGYLKLADKVGSHGEYYAQIADLSKNDFSKGFTWTMDVKVADYNADARWTSLFTFGDGVLGKGLEGANSNVAYHYTLGLDNILDFKAGFVSGSTKGGKLGWYGAGQFVNDAANGMGDILAAPAAPYSYAWYEDSTKRNRWDTIAGTVAEDGTMSIYYDGTLMATYKDDSYKNILEAMKKATTNYLGESYWNGADNDFAGYIDNVGIYNSALSADDIKKLTASAADTTTPTADTPTTPQADGKTAAIAFTDGPTVSANRKKITAEFSVKPDKVTATGTNTVKISGKKVTITYKKALKIGKKIKVTATKGTSSKSKTVTVKGTFTISGVKAKKNTKKITGKVNVKKATVKVKVGKKKYKKATVKGKKFTFKTSKLKKGTKVIIKVTKKNYKTKTKTVKVK